MRQDTSHTVSSRPLSSRTSRLWRGALCVSLAGLALTSVLWIGIDEINLSSQGLSLTSRAREVTPQRHAPPEAQAQLSAPLTPPVARNGHEVVERALIALPQPGSSPPTDGVKALTGRGFEPSAAPALLDIPLTDLSSEGVSTGRSAQARKTLLSEKTLARAPRTPELAGLVSGQGVVEVPLRSESGGLWVDVRLNDKVTYRMLLDTGASVVIVPGALAEDLGIHENGVERELRTIQGSLKGKLVTLDRIGLGTAQATDVPAVVLRGDDQTVGLLGRSFLSRFAFGVDLDKGTLTLRPRQTSASLPPLRNPTQHLARATELLSVPTEYGPAQFVAHQLERLELEKVRAASDPNLKPGYLAQLDQAVDHWKSRQQLYP